MMGPDEVDDLLRQLVFFSHLHANDHVIDDDARTFHRFYFLMRTKSFGLILSKEIRIFNLSNIMMHCPRADKKGVATDMINGFFSQVGHLQTMLESTRNLLAQFP